MKKTLKIFFLFSLIFISKNSFSSTIINSGSNDILPISKVPINNEELNIKNKIAKIPIQSNKNPESKADGLKQINKIKNNTTPFFEKLNKEINSPTIVLNGETYERNKIVDINGGKIVLTPIESSIKETKIVLPKGLSQISPDVKWVNYDDYIKEQERLKIQSNNENKKKEIQKPNGYYNSKDSSDYVDDFFDREINHNDDANIKKGINEIFNEYNKKDEKIIKNTLIKNKDEAIKNLNLQNSYKNIVDLYSNPDRKETLGYISNDIVTSTPNAIRSHNIPKKLVGKPVYIRIFKDINSLELYLLDHGKYKLANIYNICTFSGGLGPKKTVGDSKSPEGFYSFNTHSLKPDSEYFRSINLGFPNQYDRENGYTGDLLMIHGGCQSVGCYAMTDDYMKEIYDFSQAAIKNGQSTVQVDVFPFKMTTENMNKYKNNENYNFWKDLKLGYDVFEKTGNPPKVIVKNKKYVII